MDFETTARERIPILSAVLKKFSMAMELNLMLIPMSNFDRPTFPATTRP